MREKSHSAGKVLVLGFYELGLYPKWKSSMLCRTGISVGLGPGLYISMRTTLITKIFGRNEDTHFISIPVRIMYEK